MMNSVRSVGGGRGRFVVGRRTLVLVGLVVVVVVAAACHRFAIVGSPVLTEEGVLFTRPFAGSSTKMFDGEGMAFVEVDNTLWLADDNGNKLYEMDVDTGALVSTVDTVALEAVLEFGGGAAAGPTRAGDLEAVAYDAANDYLYAISNSVCGGGCDPTIFRFTRSGGSLVPESWQALTGDHPAAAATPDGELFLSSGSMLHAYDYETNVVGAGFSIPGLLGQMVGLSFSTDGYDMWVGTSVRIYRVDWDTQTVVPGYAFDFADHGLGDSRAVEAIGDLLYVQDGDDSLLSTDPLKYAIHVYSVDGTPVSPTLPVSVVSASPTVGLAPLTVDFDASASSDPDGSIVQYYWFTVPVLFPIEATDTPTFSYEFTTPGVYTMTMTAEDDGGNILLTGVPVTVKETNVAPVLDPVGDQSVDEQTQLAFSATASDTNVPVDTLTFSLDGAVPAGAAITAGGDFTWTPTEAEGGAVYSFDVVVTDDGIPALEDRETITVTVAEVNAAPVLDPIGDQSVDEETELAFTAIASDADLPADTLTFSLDGTVPAGAAITAGGDFTWTPTAAQGPGVYTFDVVVTDDGTPTLEDRETIEVTVSDGANTAPVLDPVGNQSVDEGTLLAFTATASDIDVPAQTLTFSLDGTVPAGAAITAGGGFSWTPTEAQGPGVYTFDVVVTDDGTPALEDRETIDVTVNDVNNAPVLDPIGNQSVDEETLLAFTATATDPDTPAQTLTFSLDGTVPTGAAITAGGDVTWTPTEAQGPGVYTFDVVVTDDGTPALEDRETIDVTVDEINVAPVLDPIGNQSVDEGTLLAFTATATDADVPAQTLTFSLDGAVPAGAAITAGGDVTWTPTEAQGGAVYTFDIVVTDDGTPALEDRETIDITVNDVNAAPVLDPIGDQSVAEGTLLAFTATASDPDTPAQTLTFSLDGTVPAGAAITAAGDVTWTPTEAQGPGVYTFDVVVTDDGTPALEDRETIEVTVDEVNVAPVLGSVGNQTVDEESELAFTATATDSDVPAQALTFSLDGTVPAGAAITAGGDFTWTPTEAQGPGVYTFDIVVTDDGPGLLEDRETIDVTVNDVSNTAPVLDPVGNQTVDEGVLLAFTATASDSDTPAQTLTFSLDGTVPAGAAITAGGDVTWTPTEAQGPGVYTFDVVVTDDGTPNLEDRETIDITVDEVNGAPLLDPVGNQTVDEETLLAFSATATDADDPANTLTFSLDGTVPAGAAITAGGDFTWTPTEAQGPGVYTFDVVVTDDGTPALEDRETIQVTVDEVNVAPVLDPVGNQTVDEGVLLAFTAIAADADDPANTLTFSLEGTVPAGAAITAGGDVTWTPTEAQGPGVYTFDVVVTDDGTPALEDRETIDITVAEVNTAPVLDPVGNQTVDEGSLLAFTATATDADVPAQALTFSLDGTVPAGAAITAGGDVTWTPTEAQGPGVYSFDVVVTDDGPGLLEERETIQVTVDDVNNAPVLDPVGNQSVDEGSLLAFTATATDTDEPANTLTFSLDGTVPAGAAITAGGDVTWTPTEAQGPGVYSFDVVVTDDGTPALEDRETIDVTVDEANVAPLLDPVGNQTVDEEVELAFTATASDADLPAQGLTFSLDGTVPAGAAITAGGDFTWTPTEAQGPGVYTFDIVVTDDGPGLLEDRETIDVTVDHVNSAPVLDPIGNKTVDEGSLLAFTVTATDPDVPADNIGFFLLFEPAGASITAGGDFTWTPTEAQGPGNYNVVVGVLDDGDPAMSDFEQITVTVNEVNTAPLLDPVGDQVVDEGVELAFTATASDADAPPQTLTFSLEGTVPAGASITAGGDFTWTPTEAQGPGVYTFDVVVTDDGPGLLEDREAIDVTVDHVNSAPVLDPIGARIVDEETLLAFTATATDPDVPADGVTFSLDGTVPAGAAITAGGDFTWTPTEAQGPGSYEFDVVVTDDGAPNLEDRETITVTVLETGCARSVQHGTTTSTTNGLTSVSITTVDPTRAFLVFSTRHDSNRPVGTLIRGRLNGAGTAVEFVRVTDEGSPVAMTMDWYVVEYACGVRVQRGEVAPSSTVVNVPITPVASTSQAFVTWSKTPTATDASFGANDYVLAELTSTSNLQLRTDEAASTHLVAWQVIEFLDAADVGVQTGSTTMTGSTASVTDTIPVAVDLSRSFLLVGYTSDGSGADIGERMIRAELTDPTTVTFTRGATGDNITEITWQVVEFLDGTTVQSGTQHFDSGVGTQNVAITAVDTSRAWAIGSVQGGSGQNQGASPYTGNDIVGVGAVSADLSAGQLTLRRDNTADEADVTWFVID